MNKKRYWLKLKENYFDEDEIMFLKSQKNGYEYIYLWMRLLLKCLKVDEEKDCGILRVNGKVPYDETMIATLFGMNIDVVRVGIKIFQEMGMLEIQEDGTFYIEAVQKMIGKEGESAERMRLHRENKKLLQLAHSDKEVTEGDDNIIRIKEEKEIDKEITDESFDKFWNLYDKKVDRNKSEKLWNKIKPELRDNIFIHITNYIKSTPDKQYRKNPDTYLRNKCWENELVFKPKEIKQGDNNDIPDYYKNYK